jgi:hypothetical protein
LAIVVALPLLAVAPIALANVAGRTSPAVSFHLSVSRHALSYRGRPAVLSIRMQTGASAETVAIEPMVSVWADPNVIGSPLKLSGERVSGAGRITTHSVSSCCTTTPGTCARGAPPPEGSGVDLSLPAESTTTLTYRVALAAPPWRHSPMSVSVSAGIPAVANDPNAIREHELGTRRFTIHGPTGVHITLSLPRGLAEEHAGELFVAHGRGVTILGRTTPRLRGQRFHVAYQHFRQHPDAPPITSHGSIGTAVTDNNGLFRIAWRPARAGLYVIDATYRQPTRGLLADRTCDLALTVQ